MKRGPKPRPLPQRFWEMVEKTGPKQKHMASRCWNWTGSPDAQTGYGHIGVGPPWRQKSVHRVSWEIHFGEIPQGKFVLHRCDNRICVRPDHLFIGTHQDNMTDMWKKGRAQPRKELPGEGHARAILTNAAVNVIIIEVKKHGRKYGLQSALARRFGVGVTAIANVVNGVTWTHLTGGRL